MTKFFFTRTTNNMSHFHKVYAYYCLIITRNHMKRQFDDDKEWFVSTQPHARQTDSNSCGVLCLKVRNTSNTLDRKKILIWSSTSFELFSSFYCIVCWKYYEGKRSSVINRRKTVSTTYRSYVIERRRYHINFLLCQISKNSVHIKQLSWINLF